MFLFWDPNSKPRAHDFSGRKKKRTARQNVTSCFGIACHPESKISEAAFFLEVLTQHTTSLRER